MLRTNDRQEIVSRIDLESRRLSAILAKVGARLSVRREKMYRGCIFGNLDIDSCLEYISGRRSFISGRCFKLVTMKIR